MYIKVTAKAGSKKDAVSEKNGRYIVETRAKAKEGEANDAVLILLARHLGVATKQLSLVRGSDRPSKLYIFMTEKHL